jgi:hypothetical protein
MNGRTTVEQHAKKRIGRPPGRKAPHRPVVSARVPKALYAAIKGTARAAGRTVGEELIWRVERSYEWEKTHGGDARALSSQDNITATPSGTQSTSILLNNARNRITTVATAADGVRLPPALAGAAIVVTNDAATNAANVWPSGASQGGIAGGDRINALAANTAYSLTVGAGPTTFYCFGNGTWRTK